MIYAILQIRRFIIDYFIEIDSSRWYSSGNQGSMQNLVGIDIPCLIQSKNRSRRASGPSRVSSSCSRSWINVRAVIRLPSDPGRMWTRHRASRSRRCRSRRSSTAGCRPVSRRDRPRHGRTIPIGHHLSVISSILSSVLMKRSFIFSRYSSSAFHSPRSMAS